MNVNNEINKNNALNALIEMLTSIQDRIPENVGKGLYADEMDVVLGVTINYLQSMIASTPVKTSNFKLTCIYDGYKFYDVVNATDEQTAFSYLCWITNSNDDLHFVKAEICAELPSYWCPVGWVKPDPAYVFSHVAQYRSLMQSLEVAGITQHDYYTPELDKVMRSLGYSVSDVILVTDDVLGVFNGKYIEYTKQDRPTLRVEIKEDN